MQLALFIAMGEVLYFEIEYSNHVRQSNGKIKGRVLDSLEREPLFNFNIFVSYFVK